MLLRSTNNPIIENVTQVRMAGPAILEHTQCQLNKQPWQYDGLFCSSQKYQEKNGTVNDPDDVSKFPLTPASNAKVYDIGGKNSPFPPITSRR